MDSQIVKSLSIEKCVLFHIPEKNRFVEVVCSSYNTTQLCAIHCLND